MLIILYLYFKICCIYLCYTTEYMYNYHVSILHVYIQLSCTFLACFEKGRIQVPYIKFLFQLTLQGSYTFQYLIPVLPCKALAFFSTSLFNYLARFLHFFSTLQPHKKQCKKVELPCKLVLQDSCTICKTSTSIQQESGHIPCICKNLARYVQELVARWSKVDARILHSLAVIFQLGSNHSLSIRNYVKLVAMAVTSSAYIYPSTHLHVLEYICT